MMMTTVMERLWDSVKWWAVVVFLKLMNLRTHVQLRLHLFRQSQLRLPPIVPEEEIVDGIAKFGTHGATDMLEAFHARYGDIFCFVTPQRLLVFLSDPAAVSVVMSNKDVFNGRGIKLEARYGLLALPTNDMWKYHRSLVSKAFSEPALKRHNEIIASDTLKLINYLSSIAQQSADVIPAAMEPIHVVASDEGKLKSTDDRRFGQHTVDIHHSLTSLTYDIIGKLAFGYDFETFNNKESDAFKAADILITEGARRQGKPDFMRYFPLDRYRQWKWAREYNLNAMTTAIQGVRTMLKANPEEAERLRKSKNPVVEGNILQAMLTASDATGARKLSTEEIYHEAGTMLGAGHETTANTLSWSLLMLGENPDIQKAVREECQRILTFDGQKYLPPTFAQWRRLELVQSVILETLRLRPTVPVFPRRAETDTILCGYTIPEKSLVTVLQSGLNRKKQLWGDDAASFNPFRFVNSTTPLSGFTSGIPQTKGTKLPSSSGVSSAQTNENNYNFMPFGGGPRSCVGRRLALMETVMILSSIVSNYQVYLPNGVSSKTIPAKTDITYGPKFGLPLLFKHAEMKNPSHSAPKL